MITPLETYKFDKKISFYNIEYTYNEYRDRLKEKVLYKHKRATLFFLRGIDRAVEKIEFYQGFVDAIIRFDKNIDKNMIVEYREQDYEIVWIGEEGRDKYLRVRLKLIDN